MKLQINIKSIQTLEPIYLHNSDNNSTKFKQMQQQQLPSKNQLNQD